MNEISKVELKSKFYYRYQKITNPLNNVLFLSFSFKIREFKNIEELSAGVIKVLFHHTPKPILKTYILYYSTSEIDIQL